MTVKKSEIQSFAKGELLSFDLSNFDLDADLALKELVSEIQDEWEELNSAEVMESRANYFNIPQTEASDYAERILELGEGKSVIYGIRHFGMNRDLPFVNLKPNFKIENPETANKIYQKIKPEFEKFSPLNLSFWSSKQIEVNFIGSTYLVGKASEIKALKPWSCEERLELKKVVDDSYYDWYENGYAEFHRDRPDLKEKVTLNSLDSMRDSVEQGLMFEVFMEGAKIGLIAGEKSPLLGHPGIYFQEIFLSRNYKGKGLAKAIQRKFVETAVEDGDFIWGTVDRQNLPSFKTALSNGRIPIRYECFINVDS